MFATSLQAQFSSDTDASQLKAIATRVNDGEKEALLEASKLQPDVAVPFLKQYIKLYNIDRDRDAVVIMALRNMSGSIAYLNHRLSEATAKGAVDTEAFALLSVIGTEQAATIAAPYLFDFTTTPGDGHILCEVNALSATLALSAMQLDNGATSGTLSSVRSKDILAWQQWAINRGLASRDAQPGVPDWISELETLSSTPEPMVTQPAATSLPMSTQSTPQPLSSPEPTVTVQPKPEFSGFPIVSVVILAAVIVAVAVFLLRRKSL